MGFNLNNPYAMTKAVQGFNAQPQGNLANDNIMRGVDPSQMPGSFPIGKHAGGVPAGWGNPSPSPASGVLGRNPFGDPNMMGTHPIGRPEPGAVAPWMAGNYQKPDTMAGGPSWAGMAPSAAGTPSVSPWTSAPAPQIPNQPMQPMQTPPITQFIDQNQDGIDDRMNQMGEQQIQMKYEQDMAKHKAKVQEQYWKKLQSAYQAQQQAVQQQAQQAQVGPPPQAVDQFGRLQSALDSLGGMARVRYNDPFSQLYNQLRAGKATSGSGSSGPNFRGLWGRPQGSLPTKGF
jgi:hypothetical protein